MCSTDGPSRHGHLLDLDVDEAVVGERAPEFVDAREARHRPVARQRVDRPAPNPPRRGGRFRNPSATTSRPARRQQPRRLAHEAELVRARRAAALSIAIAPSNAPDRQPRRRVVHGVERGARADAVTVRRRAGHRHLLGQQRDAVQTQRRPRAQHERRRRARAAAQVREPRQRCTAALEPRQHLQRHLVDHRARDRTATAPGASSRSAC